MSTTYTVRLTGANPLLLHNHNIDWADAMKAWAEDPANKKASRAGDDRTPAYRWMGCLYVDEGKLVIPSDNLMTLLREGGALCPTGKKQQTFKRQTQSGIIIDQLGWPIEVNGRTIEYAELEHLQTEKDFLVHVATVQKFGFELFKKPVTIGKAKHIRVRPRFRSWAVSGTITVLDDTITKKVLTDILTFAGRFAGLGDWRPSSKNAPGQFGTFKAEVLK